MCNFDAAFVTGLVYVILLNVLSEMCAVSTGNTNKRICNCRVLLNTFLVKGERRTARVLSGFADLQHIETCFRTYVLLFTVEVQI